MKCKNSNITEWSGDHEPAVPYSDNAVMTEYFDTLKAYDADWLTVLTIIEDPAYLDQPFITSTHFKREADSSKWAPTRCEQPT